MSGNSEKCLPELHLEILLLISDVEFTLGQVEFTLAYRRQQMYSLKWLPEPGGGTRRLLCPI